MSINKLITPTTQNDIVDKVNELIDDKADLSEIPTKVSDLTNDSGYTTNTGTVTSIATGAGLSGGTITGSGTVKAALKSETQSTLTATTMGSISNRQYAVGLDANGDLSVNVPWTTSPVYSASATLFSSDWVNNSQTVNVVGVTADSTILVTYAPSSKTDYTTADIYCTGQGTGTLTFTCSTPPAVDIVANIIIIDGVIPTIPSAAGGSF